MKSSEARTYSNEQMAYQRKFGVRPDGAHSSLMSPQATGWERFTTNVATLGAGLTADLVESHLMTYLKNATFEKKIHNLEHASGDNEQKIRNFKGLLGAFEFIEEYASDKAYSDLMNAWLRKKTGVENAAYASEASAFISEWGNAIVQVFFKNRSFGLHEKNDNQVVMVHGKPKPKTLLNGWIILAHPMENFINPVTVEASLRLLEQMPGGRAVTWAKEKLDHTLEHNKKFQYVNTLAAKGLTGYHIFRNIAPVA